MAVRTIKTRLEIEGDKSYKDSLKRATEELRKQQECRERSWALS